jgi:hypothetical protein
MSKRWGTPLSRQTMVDWIRITAEWCEPIYKRMLAELRAGRYLQADKPRCAITIPMNRAPAVSKVTCGC